MSPTITPTATATPERIAIYPNPCSLANGEGRVKFDFLPQGTTVKIYNIQGYKVAEYGNLAGKFEWNCTNKNGEKVAAGIYFYDVDAAGKKYSGKLFIVK